MGAGGAAQDDRGGGRGREAGRDRVGMDTYGVTPAGFVVKPFAEILGQKAARAREMFGEDIDLRSTSSLRKILDVAAAEDHELWKGAERLFYAMFLSTATG